MTAIYSRNANVLNKLLNENTNRYLVKNRKIYLNHSLIGCFILTSNLFQYRLNTRRNVNKVTDKHSVQIISTCRFVYILMPFCTKIKKHDKILIIRIYFFISVFILIDLLHSICAIIRKYNSGISSDKQ